MPPKHSSAALQTASKSKGKFSLASSKSQQQPNNSSNHAAGKRKRTDNHGRAQGAASDASDEDDDDLLNEEQENGDDGDDNDTDEEIENAKEGKSKKTQKRKRRAVSPTSFGQALSAFLGDEEDDEQPEPSTSSVKPATSKSTSAATKPPQKTSTTAPPNQAPIFSLAPSVRSRISSTQLNAKASRIALEERRKREEQYRVKDLIGGWGRPGEVPGQSRADQERGAARLGEDSDGDDDDEDGFASQGGSKGYERRLRKVAQRGVVKLFNAIRAAQSTTEEDLEEKDKMMPSSTLSSHTSHPRPGQDTVTGKNALGGKSKELAELSKHNFLDMIRSGAGSKAKA